ncbi:Phage tail protein I [uncultured Alphaproteobacteria bacterium]|uniref:Phage tail protein I n=1 Tax=uncultured Alphaproteobacteria bacterium TaxID=91750 RepID=A0A212J3U9_9PROT|nr:Phage tail protein I [uncultured Alphaproteobacteria bacterium]
MNAPLLPPGSADIERALDATIAARFDAVPVPVATVGDPAACPAAVLPYLGWAESTDTWDPSWSVATKRQVVARAIPVHRVKGTLGAVEDVLAAAGFPASTIVRAGARRHDASAVHDGRILHGPEGGWAMYRVILSRPIRNDQVAGIRRLLEVTAATRCQLLSLEYQEVSNLHDGRSRHDGAYNYGRA